MSFKRAEFQQALILNNQSIDQYLILCLRASLQTNEELKILQRELFTEIKRILTDSQSLPILRVSCAKFLIYLFYLGDMDVYQNIQRNIYPLIKEYARVDKQLPLNNRGQKFFLKHPDYKKANETGKQMTKILGVDFIRFFLQTVPVWANQFPTDQQIQTKPSVYYNGYQQLKRQGVKFPSESEYAIYTKGNIEKRQNKLMMLIDRFDMSASLMVAKNSSLLSQRIRGRDSILGRTLSKLSLSRQPIMPPKSFQQKIQLHSKTATFHTPTPGSTNGMQFQNQYVANKYPSTNSIILQNVISEQGSNLRTSIIQTPQTQTLIRQEVQIQTHQNVGQSAMGEVVPVSALKQQAMHIEKNYQMRMEEMMRNHQTQMEQTVISLRSNFEQQIHQLRNICEQLKQQNMLLKSDLNMKTSKLNQFSTTIHTMNSQLTEKNMKLNQFTSMIHSLSTENAKITQQFQQIVHSTRQNSQSLTLEEIRRLKIQNFELKKNLLDDCMEGEEFHIQEYKEQKDRFVAFDSADKLLISSTSRLSPDDRLRFKKCLLKWKGILYKNKHIEVGCVTGFKELNIIKIKLCITNISPSQIHSFNIQFSNSDDIQFLQKQSPARTLPSQYQQQLTYMCKIRHKNFRIPEFKITYLTEGVDYGVFLLFPATKCKLIQYLNNPRLTWYTQQIIDKVIPINKLILSDISKFKDIYPTIYEAKQAFILPFTYLNEQYQLEFRQIDPKNMRVKICYERGNEDNAYELLDEFAFLLGNQ